MTEKNVNSICKWASAILILLSAIMLFRPAMIIEDKDDRSAWRKQMKSSVKNYKMDEDELEKYQEQLEHENIDINLKKFLKSAQKINKAIEDGKISTCEICLSGLTFFDIIESIQDIDELRYMYGSGMDKLDDLTDAKPVVIIVILFSCLIIVSSIGVILFHIAGKKPIGVSVVLLNLILLIILKVIVGKVNIFAEDVLDKSEDFFELTSAPIWGFLFAVFAMLLWMFKDRAVAVLVHGAVNKKSFKSATIEGKAEVCGNCGTKLNEGTVFCPKCGTKHEPLVVQQPFTGNIQENSEPLHCPECGTVIDSDAIFCGNCGYKL